MSFTEINCLDECLLKVLIAEAWADGGIDTEKREIINGWIMQLRIEGPEHVRLKELTARPIDKFQADLYNNELKANLTSGKCRCKVEDIVRTMRERKILPTLEQRFIGILERLLGERSNLELLILEALGREALDALGQETLTRY